jgi:hypothetical protein
MFTINGIGTRDLSVEDKYLLAKFRGNFPFYDFPDSSMGREDIIKLGRLGFQPQALDKASIDIMGL